MSQNSHTCTECGEPHTPMEAKKLHLDRQKIHMLQRAAGHVMETGSNRFKKADLGLIDFGQSAYGNWAAIARFGLTAKAWDKNTQRPVRGLWVVTRLGWAFLRGEATVKSWVMVKDKHVQHHLGYGPDRSLRGIYKGADTIQTSFEYYDDDNKMVGYRPAAPTNMEQASLL